MRRDQPVCNVPAGPLFRSVMGAEYCLPLMRRKLTRQETGFSLARLWFACHISSAGQ